MASPFCLGQLSNRSHHCMTSDTSLRPSSHLPPFWSCGASSCSPAFGQDPQGKAHPDSCGHSSPGPCSEHSACLSSPRSLLSLTSGSLAHVPLLVPWSGKCLQAEIPGGLKTLLQFPAGHDHSPVLSSRPANILLSYFFQFYSCLQWEGKPVLTSHCDQKQKSPQSFCFSFCVNLGLICIQQNAQRSHVQFPEF